MGTLNLGPNQIICLRIGVLADNGLILKHLMVGLNLGLGLVSEITVIGRSMNNF